MKKKILAFVFILCLGLGGTALAACDVCGGDQQCDECLGMGFVMAKMYGSDELVQIGCTGANCDDGVCTACAQAQEAAVSAPEPASAPENHAFADPVVKNAVLQLLQKETVTREELRQITRLNLETDNANLVLEDLQYMPALKQLQLSGGEEARPSVDFAPLAACAELKELYVSGLGELENLNAPAALYDLWISDVQMTDAQAAAIGELKKLEILYMESVPMTDLSWISGCGALREVTIAFTGITDARGLETLDNLEFVAIEENAAQPDLSFLLGRGIQSWTPMGEYIPFEEWYTDYQQGDFVEPGLLDDYGEPSGGYHQNRGGGTY